MIRLGLALRPCLSPSKCCFLVVLLLGTMACRTAPTPPAAPELVLPLENDIQTLDPAQLSDPFTSRIVWQIYEGLVGLDENGRPTPLLAESWSASRDHKVWTFVLRPGIRFHESDVFGSARSTRAVQAEDVRYSYLRFAKGFGSFVFAHLVEGFDDFVAGRSATVTGFVARGERQFEVHLVRPDPSFLYRITSPYLGIMPREAVEKNPDAFGTTVAVGTGPFRLRRKSDTEVILDANPTYWRPVRGNLQRVIFRVEKNDQIRVARFEQGGYGLLSLPTSFMSRFLRGGVLHDKWLSRFRAYRAQTFNVHYLGIDNRRITDVHLRRAIAFSLNKRAIVDGPLAGCARIADELVPRGLQGFDPPASLAFDQTAAKRELAMSKYRGQPLILLISDAPNHEACGELIQSQLGQVGIRVQIQRVDLNTLISRLFSANRPDLFLAFSEWVFSAPELILESYQSTSFPNPNTFGYSNRKVDELLARIRTTADRNEINRLCRDISSIVASEAPVVPLYHLDAIILLDRRYSGLVVNGHQHWSLSEVRFSKD